MNRPRKQLYGFIPNVFPPRSRRRRVRSWQTFVTPLPKVTRPPPAQTDRRVAVACLRRSCTDVKKTLSCREVLGGCNGSLQCQSGSHLRDSETDDEVTVTVEATAGCSAVADD
jgi:hypothetical protein